LALQFSRLNRTSDLAHSFNIWSPADYFEHYTNHLIFEFYFDGVIGNITIKQILEGYYDPTLSKIVLPSDCRNSSPNCEEVSRNSTIE